MSIAVIEALSEVLPSGNGKIVLAKQAEEVSELLSIVTLGFSEVYSFFKAWNVGSEAMRIIVCIFINLHLVKLNSVLEMLNGLDVVFELVFTESFEDVSEG